MLCVCVSCCECIAHAHSSLLWSLAAHVICVLRVVMSVFYHILEFLSHEDLQSQTMYFPTEQLMSLRMYRNKNTIQASGSLLYCHVVFAKLLNNTFFCAATLTITQII